MKTDASREIRVGALIALGFVIIFGAFFVIGKQQGLFVKRYDLKAKFGNVEGLTVGAPVRLGGVKVGTVESIYFSHDGNERVIVVEMSVSSSGFFRIKKDSQARLGSQGLLGDRTVDISLGSPTAESVTQGETIGAIETTQLNEIISESGDVLTDVKITAQNAKEISWKINHGTGSLAQIINDPRLYVSLDSLLIMWSSITEKINKGQGNLAMLVNNGELYENLTSSLKEISAFLANVNKGEGSLGKMAKSNELYDHADILLTTLNSTLAGINKGEGRRSWSSRRVGVTRSRICLRSGRGRVPP